MDLIDTAEARDWRERMVREQLVARGIRDRRVLQAMETVPRHLFCAPGTPLSEAYADYPLSIGCNQTISQPWMVADMLAVLELKGTEKVLEIGTGSGYNAALLRQLAAEVHTVERIPELAESAARRLAALEVDGVYVHTGDGTKGWPAAAPYDAIVVTAAAPEVPEPLKQQLADGGRLAVPAGTLFLQELLVIRRQGKAFLIHHGGGCRFVPLIGKFGWPS